VLNGSDEWDIYSNIVRIARAMDQRNWAAIEKILTPNATGDFGTGVMSSSSEIVCLLRGFLDICGPTQHLIGSVLIDVDGLRATSQAYVADTHLGAGDLDGAVFRTLGDYHDSWIRTPTGWRLTHRKKHHAGFVGNPLVVGFTEGGSTQ
jgi:hypothetical protein